MTTGSLLVLAARRVRAGALLRRMLGLLAALALPALAEAPRPNVLLVLADDMGIGDISALNPSSKWRTPAIDRLAREGRIFTDAHSASGVCTPSRYALLTGRYPWRGRLKANVLNGYDGALVEPGRMTLARLFKDAGYATAMVGKWHLGLEWARRSTNQVDVDYSRPFSGGPLDHGFERYHGISASLDMPPYVHLVDDRVPVPPSGNIAHNTGLQMWRAGAVGPDFRHEDVQGRFFGKAREFLGQRAASQDGRPFFLYLALASPHTPILPSPAYRGRSGANAYGDFMLELDDELGRLLGLLDQTGQASNTIVVFTSDNGFAPVADWKGLRAMGHDPSAGFRGHKADLFEGGHRIPFIVRWPGRVPAGSRCAATIGHVDLLRTFAAMLGRKLPDGVGEDSGNILAALTGAEANAEGRAFLVSQSSNGSFCIRDGPWKLALAPDSGGWSEPKPGSAESAALPRLQLYRLDTDPAERTNLVEAHPAVVARMSLALKQSMQDGRSTPGPRGAMVWPASWPQASWTNHMPGPRPAL